MEIVYEPLKMEDSGEFFHLAGDERVAAAMRFDCPRTQKESDRVLAGYLSGVGRAFALRFQPGGELWGVFAFQGGPDPDTAHLSQMLLPEQWGHGLGGQVLRDMTELAREKKWYRTLVCYILETNTASRRMAESCGFRERKHLRFPGMTEDLAVYQLEL